MLTRPETRSSLMNQKLRMGLSEESSSREPLYEKVWLKHRLSRVMDSIILFLLLLLLCYRLLFSNDNNNPWFLAFMCESWFTFTWLTIISTKWNPSYTISYPHRLFSRVAELPAVDLFVTTADPVLEPPIITVNTVLSLLALDYPSNKLACYVSDDGCSPLNLYALVEASKFAQIWVPFCNKYNVQTRAPFRYFSSNNNDININSPQEFKQEWLAVKDGYEHLCSKIQKATTKSIMLDQEFHVFSTAQLNNHPTIIKVIWENKEGVSDGVPHLIYVSREKNPNHPHHYKAGAMNVLTRVSGLMTNAPYVLNVDCDMHVNNPEILQHALCILMDPNGDKEVAFAQCPQQFYDGLKDDPFGNQLVSIFVYIGGGVSGIQGIFYVGTNCVHRRKVLYGLSPHHYDIQNGNKNLGRSSKKDIIFGSSEEFVESAAQALLEGKTFTQDTNLCNSLEAANEVAASGYEHGTDWGKQVGWMYGSSAEDVLTGLKIHTRGWKSECCGFEPIAFMGCTAQDSIVQVGQYQRWASGLLEIFLGKSCPFLGTLFGKLQFRQCLAYTWLTTWALRSVPEICYALLPAYCIITNSHFLPKDLGMLIHVALFVTYHISSLLEYLKTGLSVRSWWNNQRMFRITAMNPWMFAFVAILLKKLRICDYGFLVTKKEQPSSSSSNEDGSDNAGGRFTFNKSLVFVPGTTILLIQFTALLINIFGWQPKARSGGHGSGFGELLCSVYVVLVYLPFLKGLFGKGKYGIPLTTICKSMVLALLFVHLSMFIV